MMHPAAAIPLSANLGFLWTDRPLPDRIRAAASAGFDAVECHFPYDTHPDEVRAALQETGLPLLGLNTRPGDAAAGDFGLAALPDRAEEARAAIDQATDYAAAVGCGAIHVMAGRGGTDVAFADALAYALDRTQGSDRTILIEPINTHDVPDYFLNTPTQAAEIIARIGHPRLRMMFDCYHVARQTGDILAQFTTHRAWVAHVQFAGVPDRAEPDTGQVDYPDLLRRIRDAGYAGPFGAEYRPRGATDDGLAWMEAYDVGSSRQDK
ncbi:MAG: TIM barrel protein [Pseudomonadota bacterium]